MFLNSVHHIGITLAMAPKTYNIAAIPGDGIGVDITDAAIQVCDKLAAVDGTFSFTWNTFDWNCKNYNERGWFMPPDGMEQLKKHDAIYFGAVGWPGKSSHQACTSSD